MVPILQQRVPEVVPIIQPRMPAVQNFPNIPQPRVPNVVSIPEIPLLPVVVEQPVELPGYFDEVPGIRIDPVVQVDRVVEPQLALPVMPENVVFPDRSPMRNRLRQNVRPPVRYGQ